jgi:hypothetical protein
MKEILQDGEGGAAWRKDAREEKRGKQHPQTGRKKEKEGERALRLSKSSAIILPCMRLFSSFLSCSEEEGQISTLKGA